MKKSHALSATACGLSCVLTALSSTTRADGFVDDSTASVLARNYFIDRQYTDSSYGQAKGEEWVQSFILKLQSGYTAGTVGLGIDMLGWVTYKLDSGPGSNAQLMPLEGSPGDYHTPESFGRLGVALKMKISKTEVKVGELMPLLPVLMADTGSRSKPQTFEGVLVTSNEIDNLTLYTGQMSATSQRNSDAMVELAAFGAVSDRFNFVGGNYSFNHHQSQVGVWDSELENIYQQQLLDLQHHQSVGGWKLGARLTYTTGHEEGSALAGPLANQSYSGLLSAQLAGNTLYLGAQKISGNSAFMQVLGATPDPLANNALENSYNNAHEKSWQVRDDYNFAALGLPGLTSTLMYIHGDDVNNSTVNNGTEWGRDLITTYTIQSGSWKDLNIFWSNSVMRRSWTNNSFHENRIIVSYPISLF